MDNSRFAAAFPPATREAWRSLVDGVLKGADFEKRLVAKSRDGIAIAPLSAKSDAAPVARATPGRWRIRQRIDHPDAAVANGLALADLEGGADALVLVEAGAPTARGFGVPIAGAADLKRLLAGVRLDLVHLSVETAPFRGRQVATAILEHCRESGADPSALSIDFGLDPIGDIARTGGAPMPFPALAARVAETLATVREAGFRGPALRIDTRAYHEAGAAEAQELAAALATGVAYLRLLEGESVDLAAARAALSFLLVADADEFLSVAKLRALRRLWPRIEAACGLTPRPIALAAETAWRMTTRLDPWVNLLRATVATFSAGVGGADAVGVLPFTAALGLPDAFARRLARNTQHILMEEANLWRVADPAAGAGGFEAVTDALCERAWALFQEIEAEGGLVATLASGGFARRIAAVGEARARDVATRREAITGTSEFPNLGEADVAVLRPAPAGESIPRRGLPSRRASEPFEALRARSDAVLSRTGRRPRVFLANLGPISAFTARATFAKNFFEAGGIEAITSDDFQDFATMMNAYSDSKAELICLCSSDEIYLEQAISAIEALRVAGGRPIYLAGRPGESEKALRRAGVETFIFAGCDTLSLLSEALERAGA